MTAHYRLSRHDFSHLKVVKRVGGSHLTLVLATVSGRTSRGFACVVSKKSARKAVDRNRIKRRIRAIFREYLTILPASMIVVMYAKPGASRATMADLREESEALLKRLHPLPPGGSR